MSISASNVHRGALVVLAGFLLSFTCDLRAQQHDDLTASVNAHGEFVLGAPDHPVLVSGVAAKIDGQWVNSSDYPKHEMEKTTEEGFGVRRSNIVLSSLVLQGSRF